MRRVAAMFRTMIFAAAAVVGTTVCEPALAQNGQLPFSSNYRRPAVSAYNQLSTFGNNPQAAGNLYQQMVQPLQQQQTQELRQLDQGRQLNKLQNKVQQIDRSTTSRQVDEAIRPTGHASTYMNYSHFYPQGR